MCCWQGADVVAVAQGGMDWLMRPSGGKDCVRLRGGGVATDRSRRGLWSSAGAKSNEQGCGALGNSCKWSVSQMHGQLRTCGDGLRGLPRGHQHVGQQVVHGQGAALVVLGARAGGRAALGRLPVGHVGLFTHTVPHSMTQANLNPRLTSISHAPCCSWSFISIASRSFRVAGMRHCRGLRTAHGTHHPALAPHVPSSH